MQALWRMHPLVGPYLWWSDVLYHASGGPLLMEMMLAMPTAWPGASAD
jgi:hypothetical protein